MKVVKKPLNIPIGDVITDPDYEANIPANYNIPTSFVRHTRKIGDEPDMSIDYFMEDDDLVSSFHSFLIYRYLLMSCGVITGLDSK